jgi:CarD family transcriptional regulator, regulator of rRNA transcription
MPAFRVFWELGNHHLEKGLKPIQYNIGETIYHPQHGIGTVKDYNTKEILGTEYSFAVLFFDREDLKVSLPAKKLEETIRKPISQDSATEILRTNSGNLEPLNSSWKVRNRKNLERLSSGDPLQLLTVFRGLQALKIKKGSLNNSDRRHLNMSLELLTEEFSVALGEPPETTRLRLEKAYSETADAA